MTEQTMRPIPLLALVVALAGLSACATPTGTAAFDAFDRYEGERVALSGYDAVFVAPVTASADVADRVDANPIGPRNRMRPLGAETLSAKQGELRTAIADAVAEVATLRDAPGPGVLTIAAELTDLDANRPTMAEMSATPSLDFRSIAVGDAGVRITLSEDGAPIGVIEDRALTRQINDPGVGIGIWGTADRFFGRTGERVAALLR